MNTTSSGTLPGRVRDVRRIPLAQLADQAAEHHADRPASTAFNSSI